MGYVKTGRPGDSLELGGTNTWLCRDIESDGMDICNGRLVLAESIVASHYKR